MKKIRTGLVLQALTRFFKKRPSIKAKLLHSFGLIIIFTAAVSIFNMNQVDELQEQNAFQNSEVNKQMTALQLKEIASELDSLKSAYTISQKEELIQEYAAKAAVFYKLVDQVGNTAGNADERKWKAKLSNTASEFTATFDQAVSIAQDTSLNAAQRANELSKAHDLSQIHKEYIFELTDNFYNAYEQDAEQAVMQLHTLLAGSSQVALWSMIMLVIFCLLNAVIMLRSFMKPVNQLKQAAEQIAAGDLRHQINSLSQDELGLLSRSFDQMAEQVRNMLFQSRSAASMLTEHSNSLKQSSETVSCTNQAVIRAIEEISAGANEQAEMADQSNIQFALLEEQMAAITSNSKEMSEKSRAVQQNTLFGSRSMEQLETAVDRSEQTLGSVFEAMDSLTRTSVQIGQIVQSISDISSQTNVLALNAAIEAARAGVHGKGFSVIAEEVRRLSSQTNDSAKHVTDIIESLLGQITNLEGSLAAARKSFLEQSGCMEGSITAFRGIHSSMEELNIQIEHIESQMDEVKQNNEVIALSVRRAAAIAQQTAAAVEEVLASSVEQDEAVQRIAGQADEILALAEDLYAGIDRFRVEE